MAATAITVTKLAFNEPKKLESFATVSASDGALIPMGADQKMLIMASNTGSSAKEITIVAGDTYQATEDVKFSVPASSEAAFVVESGRFLITKGTDAGKICVKGASTDIAVRAIELP